MPARPPMVDKVVGSRGATMLNVWQVLFDKLATARILEGRGKFPREQAEALTDAMHEAMTESVATKADIDRLRADIGRDLADHAAKGAEYRTQTIMWMCGLMVTLGVALHLWH